MSMILNPYRYAGGAFSPLDVSGCVLWLDGADEATMYDANVGGALVADDGTIARWEDKSPSGNHAKQSVLTSQPTRKASEVNGKDIVRPDGGDYLVLDSDIATTEITVFTALSRPTTGASGTSIGAFSGSGTPYAPYLFGGLIWMGLAAGYSFSNSVTGNQVLTGTRTTAGLEVEVYQNGGVIDSRAASSDNYGKLRKIFGRGGNYANFDVFEILVYNAAISTSDRESVEDYLGAKWGITITH